MRFNILDYRRMFFKARSIYKRTHGQRVMNYAGAAKAPIQRISLFNSKQRVTEEKLSVLRFST